MSDGENCHAGCHKNTYTHISASSILLATKIINEAIHPMTTFRAKVYAIE